MSDIFKERRYYCEGRLQSLAEQLKTLHELNAFPELCVYATGSYARFEASEHSDLDVFFVHFGDEDSLKETRINQIRLFAAVIACAENMKFPAFSNDGEFLQILCWKETLKQLGGRSDDFFNHFTARMLLLLESRPLANESYYEGILEQTIGSYFRDYADHVEDFQPTFLINDIMRFWKTLCLNYEFKRNTPDLSEAQRIKLKIKNFKLKHSRMLTCWATIIGLLNQTVPVTQQSVKDLVRLPPRERLNTVTGDNRVTEAKAEIDECYRWFLMKTALPANELFDFFASDDGQKEARENADRFGDRIFQLVLASTRGKSWVRYLVV